jgi:hypothetical protein
MKKKEAVKQNGRMQSGFFYVGRILCHCSVCRSSYGIFEALGAPCEKLYANLAAGELSKHLLLIVCTKN